MGWLDGKSVVVTRASHQIDEISSLIREHGGKPIELSVIEVIESSDGGESLRAAVNRLASYDWLVVTSQNTVAKLAELVADLPPGSLPRIAAIGSATAEALNALNLPVDLIPEQFVAEGLVEVFPAGTGRVLLPRAGVARDVLPDGLRAKGWHVDVVEAYRTAPTSVDEVVLDEVGSADAVTFTSPSTVNAFVAVARAHRTPSVVACIGPVTAAAARAAGLEVDVVPAEHTVKSLVESLDRWA